MTSAKLQFHYHAWLRFDMCSQLGRHPDVRYTRPSPLTFHGLIMLGTFISAWLTGALRFYSGALLPVPLDRPWCMLV